MRFSCAFRCNFILPQISTDFISVEICGAFWGAAWGVTLDKNTEFWFLVVHANSKHGVGKQ